MPTSVVFTGVKRVMTNLTGWDENTIFEKASPQQNFEFFLPEILDLVLLK